MKTECENVNMKPNIIVSSQDLDQIERLIDALPPSEHAVKTALLDELARAEIMDANDIPASVVTMNAIVRFQIEKSNQGFCLTLSYPKDMGERQEKISVLSPVGSALLGLSIGDHIEWPRPDGKMMKIEILDVIQQNRQAAVL